jgi:hypothetical protein
MNEATLLTAVLSSTVISAVISGFVSTLSGRRNDRVENITKERKVWREELRKISSIFFRCQGANGLKYAINKLKVRINPYGVVSKRNSEDWYIWEQIKEVEAHIFKTDKPEPNNVDSNKTEPNADIEHYKKVFIGFISCLLKDDWDRSKREIDGSYQAIGAALLLAAGVALYAFKCYDDVVNNGKYMGLVSYCAVLYFMSGITILIVTLSNKRKHKILTYFLVCACFAVIMSWFLWNTHISQIANSGWTGVIICLVSFAALAYVACASIYYNRKGYKRYIKAIDSFKRDSTAITRTQN